MNYLLVEKPRLMLTQGLTILKAENLSYMKIQPDVMACVFNRIYAQATGGTVTSDTSGIHVTKANEVLLFVSAATSFNGFDKCPDSDGKDEKMLATKTLSEAVKKPYSSLKKAHLADYQKYFKRVSFNLKDTVKVNASASLPSDDRLNAYSKGAYAPFLETLYF